jgi:hypothetical protein
VPEERPVLVLRLWPWVWPSLLKLLPVPKGKAVLVLRLQPESGLLCWNCYLCQKRELYLSCASGRKLAVIPTMAATIAPLPGSLNSHTRVRKTRFNYTNL